MKLYFAPGTCSLAPHVVAHEIGIALEIEKVNIKTDRRTASGKHLQEITPKEYVPVLELDDGEILTEGQVIAQYLADLKPEHGLAPPQGTFERYRLLELLGYINSELHKGYSPLFDPGNTSEQRTVHASQLRKRYALIEHILEKTPYLLGDSFSVADAYLFTVTNWARTAKLDVSDFPALAAFQQRVGQRPAVRAAMRAEGLLPKAA